MRWDSYLKDQEVEEEENTVYDYRNDLFQLLHDCLSVLKCEGKVSALLVDLRETRSTALRTSRSGDCFIHPISSTDTKQQPQ